MSIEDKQEHGAPALDNPMPSDPNDDSKAARALRAGQNGSAEVTTSSPRRSRTAKTQEGTGTGDPAQQAAAAASPARKTRTSSKAVDAAEPAQTEPPVSKRVRRRASSTPDVAQLSTQSALPQAMPERGDIPPVTEEAIRFLANPEAKVPDIFKLKPQSREFVLYHVSNMQRLEAEIASGRSYLATHMPKFSPEFEKTADAILARLATSGRAVAGKVAQDAGNSTSTSPANFYGPHQVTEVIQVKASPRIVRGAKVREGDVENTIERGPLHELDKRPSTDMPQQEPGGDGGKSTPGLSKKVLRMIGSSAQVAGAWLHSRATPAVTATVAERLVVPGNEPVVAEDKTKAVPASVVRRFLKVETDYYFPDKTLAFVDRGEKLATRGAHPEVVRSLVEIAQARGWSNITVKGTEEFRRSAWMEAAQAGLKVAGYQPTALDLAELANRPVNNMVEKGRIPDLGKAPASPSVAASGRPQTGGRSAETTPKVPPVPNPELFAKASAFEKDKPSFVLKNHPELAPAYGVVDVARKFAEAHLPEEAREEFVGLARRHVLQKIVTGETVKGPKIYMSHAKSRKANDREPHVAKEAIDQGKAPRAKEVAKER
ncbi:hypothetical protein HAV22_02550 [Massilia sp. TW-1]|uniref:Large polyvalent protein-associated domain-containing protein n=1 Tax=Telluria antibiotica TaxID=2717319 RepID=A0ABX0P5N1_9BURK|nr:LPD7 domain-containing protein [Telluria antibiotica]NIA52535.1 hypothetical protein [Telluria antibiotica]